jgi:hypothetical protein
MNHYQPSLFRDIQTTLQTAVAQLRQRIAKEREDGCVCPICDQNCKVYKRKLNSGMAACLCWLVREFTRTGESVHVNVDAPRYVLRSNETSRMVWWGLVESMPSKDPSRKSSGVWRPTELGIAFARGEVTVARHAHLYNNQLHRFSDEQTTIREALGDHFNYEELMSGDAQEESARQ